MTTGPSTSLIHELSAIDNDESLLEALHVDIENGGFFNAVGLHGFVEEAIFSWYLDAPGNKTISLCLGSVVTSALGRFFAMLVAEQVHLSKRICTIREKDGRIAAPTG